MIARVALILALLAIPVEAAPIAAVNARNVTITLFDESCALDVVSNLPLRATWTTPAGKQWEGCYEVNQFDIVVMFFADLTAISVPTEAFRRVRQT